MYIDENKFFALNPNIDDIDYIEAIECQNMKKKVEK